LQQRRFSGSIAANDRDALARINLQRHVVEQRQMAEGNRDVIECDQRHERECVMSIATKARRPKNIRQNAFVFFVPSWLMFVPVVGLDSRRSIARLSGLEAIWLACPSSSPRPSPPGWPCP